MVRSWRPPYQKYSKESEISFIGTIPDKVFDNKITFYNPGALYRGITLSELKGDHYQAQARNKLIAEAFYLTKDIEKYGSGFSRIRQEVATYPTMEFVYEEKTYGFFAQLAYRVQKSTTDPVELGEKLSTVQVQIISAMKANAAITQTGLSVLVGISTTSIDNNIRKLRKMGIIKRVGPAKGGHWEIYIAN
ncbi:ATP-dependent DNA helicase RecG [bacterium A37T11]|nr:ATP-dependent DNA helicase RecG [bacterium A37T11]